MTQDDTRIRHFDLETKTSLKKNVNMPTYHHQGRLVFNTLGYNHVNGNLERHSILLIDLLIKCRAINGLVCFIVVQNVGDFTKIHRLAVRAKVICCLQDNAPIPNTHIKYAEIHPVDVKSFIISYIILTLHHHISTFSQL